MNERSSFELSRSLLQVLALGILIASSAWIVRPFLTALVWATTIVVATWPLLLSAQGFLGGRRGLATATMTLALLLLVIGPLAWGIEAVLGNSDQIVEWSKHLAERGIPEPPGWLEALPLVGSEVTSRWREAASKPPEELAAQLAPHARELAMWLVSKVGGVGMLLVQFLMTVVISAILYANGETAAVMVTSFARRLAGDQGENSVQLAAQAIRGVALGVVVTAVLQTALVAAGLAVVGVPFASFLTAIVFVLCVAQVGPFLVVLPTAGWLWSTSGSAWGAGFLVWGIACGLMDNFVRPVLIRRGADLPLLLIFSGVVGGLLAMGVIGLFLGPTVLAVAYKLLEGWVAEQPADNPSA